MAVVAAKRHQSGVVVGQRSSRINVGRLERWLSMVAGGALAAYGLQRRETQGGAAAIAGAALLYRGATGHCNLYQALGIDRGRAGRGVRADLGSDTRQQLAGRRGTNVEDAVLINRPAVELYRFWRDFENLPKFMKHLESVSIRDGGVSHWIAKGPGGLRVEWDARVINDIDGRLIAWQSLTGSDIATAGSVHFEETPGGTAVRVHLQYRPPAGKLGTAIAWLFREEPSIQVHDDLRRFKQLMETGEISRQ